MLRVCFVTTQRHGPADDWHEERKFLPDTLFFRLVAYLVRDVKRTSDQFKDLYCDRVVIRTSEPKQRYILLHRPAERALDGAAGVSSKRANRYRTALHSKNTACMASFYDTAADVGS